MNPYLRLDGVEMWHIAGWTMVHFLWLGALVGIVSAGCRLGLRRSSPNVRYLVAAASLAVLTAMPLAIAGWLAGNSPLFQGGAREGFFSAGHNARHVQSRHDDIEPSDSVAERKVQGTEPVIDTIGSSKNVESLDYAAEPSPSPSLKGRGIFRGTVESCVTYFPWIWLVGTPLTLALLATGIVGTERLRRASQPVAAGPLTEMVARLASSLRVGRRVAIGVCDRVCAPVLVGILRPMILLPPAALTGWSPDEIEMVLLHELAHVRRWDNLVNLLQRLVEAVLFFHPAVWLVSSWMRRDREACCDAIVVTCTRRPQQYAELLVALAAQMPRSVLFHPAASSAMAASPLRHRIRRILQLEDDPMLISGKSFAVMLAGLLTAATLAVLYLPTRGQAEESAAEVTGNSEQSEENAELADVAEEAGANETQIDSPTDQAVLDAEDDWLSAAEFASPKEREIAERAFKEWGFKVFPLTEAELEEVRRGGFRGGLKLIGLEDVMNTQGPLILTHIQSKRLATGVGDFASLERALDAFASQLPDELLVLQGIKGTMPRGGIFRYTTRRPKETNAESTPADAPDVDGQANSEPVDSAVNLGPSRRVEVEQLRVGDEDVWAVRGAKDNVNAFVNQLKAGETREGETTDPIFVAYNVPQELIRDLETWAKLMHVQRGVSDKPGRFIVQAPADVHDRLNSLLDATQTWSDSTAAADRERDPVATIEQDGQRRVEWRTMGLTLGSPREVQRTTMIPKSVVGLEVIAVEPGSPAAWLTIQPNDTLTGISNFDTTSLSQMESMITTLLDGSTRVRHTITIVRSGGEQVTTYLPQAASASALRQPLQGQRRDSEPLSIKRSTFPTLEEQKLADLAWQMLQLELEPAGEDELKHVRALGYQGGVTVTGTARSDGRRANFNEIQPGQVLVGLHIWPTTSLKDVAEILQRDDLAELNPLKFYVVGARDVVVTGRISVRSSGTQPSGLSQLDAAERGSKNSAASAGDLSAYVRQSSDDPPAVSENEIKVLQDHIKTLQSQFDRIDALFKAKRRGGSASNRALTAYELAVAKGELALMQRQHDLAIKSFHDAQSQAEEAFNAVSAEYDVGNITYDIVLLTAKNLADIRRKIIQLEQQRRVPNRAAAARRVASTTSSAAPEAGEADRRPVTSAARDPKQTSSPSKRHGSDVAIAAESQEALDEFMRLASSPQTGESISVLKKIVEREKQKYDRMGALAFNNKVTAPEVETQKANYEISVERLRQAERALRYHRAIVQLHAAEYEAALEANKLAPKSISESELRKLQLKVQLAEAKYKELAE